MSAQLSVLLKIAQTARDRHGAWDSMDAMIGAAAASCG